MLTRFPTIMPFCDRMEPCGSRVTCSPAPTGTDEDFVILALEGNFSRLRDRLENDGWELGGSKIPDEANTIDPQDRFASWKLDDVNLIVTASPSFFDRFMAATSVCKKLNLLSKDDRIMVFQAVLYATRYFEPAPATQEEEWVF
jgi:hypothetical protein